MVADLLVADDELGDLAGLVPLGDLLDDVV